MNGSELAYDPRLSLLERLYIKIFGVPINGLRIRIRRIMPELTGAPKKILDAGCGRGVFTFLLAQKFPKATIIAIDTDNEQLEINRTIAAGARLENISFERQDVASLSFHNEFDMILSVDNIEHIENDTLALQCLAAALKKGGKLVLHVPAYQRRWFFFKFRTNFDVPGHFRPGYKLDDLKQKVSQTGLIIKKSCYTYGMLENLSNNISYLITGAEAKNKTIYAVLFPILNLIAWIGQNSHPKEGAGILIIASKNSNSPLYS